MNIVNREEFLQVLESVSPGLSSREAQEQTTSFVFKDGLIYTYNDHVSVNMPCKLKLTGAVQAAPLIGILQKMKEESVELLQKENDGHLIVVGKKRKAGIKMDSEILLPIDNVEQPKKWKPLADDFSDAIDVVQHCASRDESSFLKTAIHFHPQFIEACDDFQVTRYKIKSGIKNDVLVKSASVKPIIPLGMTHVSETDNWLHFKNESNLVYSMRHNIADDWEDIGHFLEVSGRKITLPKGLQEAAERAGVFSSDNQDNDRVSVILKEGKLTIVGEGTMGWYREFKKVKFKGKAFGFQITPKLLAEVSKRYNTCELAEECLKVDGGKFVYVTRLYQENESEEEQNE